jgi:hypothetical protein
MTRPGLLALAALAVASQGAAAQTYQTLTESRRVDAGSPLSVDVTFAAGRLALRPSEGKDMYRVGLKYIENVFDPTVEYDPVGHSLAVKVEGHGHQNLKDSDTWKQQLDLDLPRDVPLDLTMTFGAVKGDLDLGGLTLRSASIKTGASETSVAFSSPTHGSCNSLEFEVGAAQFEAQQLGNSGCRFVSLQGAVGQMTLDFSGDTPWKGEMHAAVKVGLGDVTLRIPESVGIRVDATRFLASFDKSHLVKRGSAYYSPNYDSASAKLVIDLDAALGNVDIERI